MKKIIHRTFLGINILFALFLLFSYLSVLINPLDFAFPAFFGLAYPYILIINIIIAIIWAVNLKYEAFISLLVIIIGINHLSNYIQLFKPREDKVGSFKVMSYNVRLFNYFEIPKKPSTEKQVLDFIKKQQPQVVCLQEFFSNGNYQEKDLEIRRALGGNYFSHIKMIGSGKNRYYGIATYSIYPIIKKGEIIHPGSSSLSIYTDILIANDTFRVFNSHLQSFRLKRIERSFLEEISASDDNQQMNEIIKISVSLKQGFARRALQSQVVKDYINRSPFPVIVVGDFNDTPVSYSYRKIRKGLIDAFVKSGYGAGFTYRGNYPPNRIDYILYDKILKSTYFEILKSKYSDHYPVVAYLKKQN